MIAAEAHRTCTPIALDDHRGDRRLRRGPRPRRARATRARAALRRPRRQRALRATRHGDAARPGQGRTRCHAVCSQACRAAPSAARRPGRAVLFAGHAPATTRRTARSMHRPASSATAQPRPRAAGPRRAVRRPAPVGPRADPHRPRRDRARRVPLGRRRRASPSSTATPTALPSRPSTAGTAAAPAGASCCAHRAATSTPTTPTIRRKHASQRRPRSARCISRRRRGDARARTTEQPQTATVHGWRGSRPTTPARSSRPPTDDRSPRAASLPVLVHHRPRRRRADSSNDICPSCRPSRRHPLPRLAPSPPCCRCRCPRCSAADDLDSAREEGARLHRQRAGRRAPGRLRAGPLARPDPARRCCAQALADGEAATSTRWSTA